MACGWALDSPASRLRSARVELSRKSSGARGTGGRADQAARAGPAASPSRLLRRLRGTARAVVRRRRLAGLTAFPPCRVSVPSLGKLSDAHGAARRDRPATRAGLAAPPGLLLCRLHGATRAVVRRRHAGSTACRLYVASAALSGPSSGARGANRSADQDVCAGAAAPPGRVLRWLRGAARGVVRRQHAAGLAGFPAVPRAHCPEYRDAIL